VTKTTKNHNRIKQRVTDLNKINFTKLNSFKINICSCKTKHALEWTEN